MSTTPQAVTGNIPNDTEQSWLTQSTHHFDFLNTYEDVNGTNIHRNTKKDSVEFFVLMVNLILSLCATLSNGAILLASKFSSGGDTPALIYVRSFCVADCMVGVYGLLKVGFTLGRPQRINCFLSESILFSSITASSFMLVNLSTNTLLHLIKPHKLMDKKSTITNMVFLWNGAFLTGFAPQMGWHLSSDSGCKFFAYFDVYYITFTMLIFIACMSSTFILLFHVKNILKADPDTFQHKDLAQIQTVLFTCRLDLYSQFLSHLPLIIYMLLNCHVCALYPINPHADLALLFFILPLLIKSVVAAAIHGSRTTQIWQVLTSFLLGHLLQLRAKHMRVQSKYFNRTLSATAVESQPTHGLSIVSLLADSDYLYPNSTLNSYTTPDVSDHADDETIETTATPRESLGSLNSSAITDLTTSFTQQRGTLNSGIFNRATDWLTCPVHGITVLSPTSSPRSSVDFCSASMIGCHNHSFLPTSSPLNITQSSSLSCESKCVLIHCRLCPAHPNNKYVHHHPRSDTMESNCTSHTANGLGHNLKPNHRNIFRGKPNSKINHNKLPTHNRIHLTPAILSAHSLSQEDLANRHRHDLPTFNNKTLSSHARQIPIHNGHGNQTTL